MATTADMTGKVCLVTGATNGHGEAVAHGLARLGADVVILGRNPDRCRRVQREIAEATGGKAPEILLCDLGSRAQIDRAAREYLDSGRPLHVLVNNAGLVNLRRKQTEDGHEQCFGVNHLGHFQLTLRLLERIRESAPARIVVVGSDAHKVGHIDFDNLDLHRRYSVWRAYANSKLATVLFSLELARRLEGDGVTVNAVDPGPVASNIGANNPGLLYRIVAPILRWTFPTSEKAAQRAIELASSPDFDGTSGAYYKFGTRREPSLDPKRPDLGAQLWEASARMTGVDL